MTAPTTPAWTPAEIGDLSGRRYVVTGVTGGLGGSIARELATRGAEVVLAARSEDKLATTARALEHEVPGARLHRVLVDLAELGSVRRAAARIAELGPVDCLVNNAGVMATPHRRTGDGFELQLATNHLGPFALTGLLLPSLVGSGDGRVVSTASLAHLVAVRAPLDDPRVHHGRYSRWDAYARSKLANLLFTHELERRLRATELPVRALAAHPGLAATNLMATGRTTGARPPGLVGRALIAGMSVAGQDPSTGALPTLMASTADLPGGTYVGPRRFLQLYGPPTVVGSRPLARDATAGRRLWEISEEATGVRYP